MKKKIFFLFAGLTLLFAPQARAQNLIKITAIPPRLEIEADPGEVVTQQIKVKNEGDTQLGMEVKIQDFVVTDKTGTPLPVEKEISGQWTSSSWITASPMKFLLNPGETKTLDLVVIVPDDATAGGHYAVIFYSPVTEGQIGAAEGTSSATGVSPNVGTLVYTNVSGEINENARVARMDLPGFSEFGPIEIVTEIENLSDTHIKPLGTIRIYDMLGNLKTTLKLDEANIFPTTSRVFANTWQTKWGLGKYKAILEAGYGSKGQALTAAVFFWIIPWRAITIAVLAVVLIVLLAIYFKKPKEVKPEKQTETTTKK